MQNIVINQTFFENFKLIIKKLVKMKFCLKTNKRPGGDEINFNVTKHYFGKFSGPFKYLFDDSSLQSGAFPD